MAELQQMQRTAIEALASDLMEHEPNAPLVGGMPRAPSYLTQPKQFLVSNIFRAHGILPMYECTTGYGNFVGKKLCTAKVSSHGR
jgi:hypothetical protein